MTIDVRRLFELEGERVSFDYTLDLSKIELWGRYPIVAPVRVTGTVENRNSIVTLAYNASVVLHDVCGRCLCEIDRPFDYAFRYILVRDLHNVDLDEYIMVDTDTFDLDELVLSDILLNLPLKFLCKDNCKGLCPICGKDLNQSDCDCLKQQTDPRFAALKELLDNNQ